MIKVFDSNMRITNLKVITDKMTVGTVYSTHKNGDDFIKTFVECKIVGNALKKLNELGLKDKDRFNILEGVIRNEPYVKNTKQCSKIVLTIFELREYQENDKE